MQGGENWKQKPVFLLVGIFINLTKDTMANKSLSSSAMLLDMHLSVYTGRKQDKVTAAEINISKNTRSKSAASVYKSLFTEDKDLEAIASYAGAIRSWLYGVTLPWADSGTRLVPTKNFFDITHELAEHEREFNRLVDVFINNYGVKVSSQAFKLGKLFDPKEFPDAGELVHKFGFSYVFTPVPQSGDFRVDIPAEAAQQVVAQFEKEQSRRIQDAMREPWDRLYHEITHIKDKMIDKDDGKPQKLYQSMLDNALGLCNALQALNLLDDPDLEAARRSLEQSLTDIDIVSLRKSPEVREGIKIKMQDLTDKFSLEI